MAKNYENGSRDGINREQRVAARNKGAFYLAVTFAVFFILVWFIPKVLQFDLSAFMRNGTIVGFLRMLLGVMLIICVIASVIRVAKSFALEGEGLVKGMRNAVASDVIWRDITTLVLAVIGGVALIVWGIMGVIS